jgi:hypothetical protein
MPYGGQALNLAAPDRLSSRTAKRFKLEMSGRFRGF